MTAADRNAERAAEIRARLEAISPTMSVRVVDDDNTLQATTARSERLGEFTDGVVGLFESLGDVKVRQAGVTIADDEEGQDLTFLLHAPKDIAYLLDCARELEDQLAKARAGSVEEWGVRRGDTKVLTCIDREEAEGHAQHWQSLGRNVVHRFVGPWEPVEEPSDGH